MGLRSGDGVIILRGLRERAGGGFRNRDRKLFNDILGNSDKSAVIGRMLEDNYESQFNIFEEEVAHSGLLGDADDGPFARFFKWIIENQDKVLAFIKAVVSIFLIAEDEPNLA